MAVLGLVNIQFVLYNDEIYVIEVNPRSSRTVPYISKVTGVPMVDLATRCMFGEKLRDMGCGTGLHPEGDYYAVKVPVFSFQKLRDLDTQLGPEMKSTGEVLGVAKTFREALLKGLTGAGYQMKKKGAVLISVRDSDKQEAIRIGERFESLGFDIYATSGTANVLNRHMVATNAIRNVDEPSPNIIDLIESGKIDYVIATSVKGRHPELGSVHIRRTAVERAIPCLTSIDNRLRAASLPEGRHPHRELRDGGYQQNLTCSVPHRVEQLPQAGDAGAIPPGIPCRLRPMGARKEALHCPRHPTSSNSISGYDRFRPGRASWWTPSCPGGTRSASCRPARASRSAIRCPRCCCPG